MQILRWCRLAGVLALTCWSAVAAKKPKQPELSPIDRYIQEATEHAAAGGARSGSPGSLWSVAAPLTDLGADLRARQIDDIVTILVAERATAVAKGATKTNRQSQVKSSVGALAGTTKATGALNNLARSTTQAQLDGEGSTTRETELTTTLSARVTHVMPNGDLVVEGLKELQVNSERQIIAIRGVVRPVDLSPGNLVRSDHLAQLEVHINGKGVVGDAVRRPFFLYRLLLGLQPF